MLSLLKTLIVSGVITLSLCSYSLAREYIFPVYGRSDIEQEIAVAKIIPFYGYMKGEIEVQWANPDLLPSVDKIITLLEKEGVPSHDIVRNFSQSMAYQNKSRDSINLVLKTHSTRTRCSTYRLRSTFDGIGEESCVLNDNIDAMKLRK